MKAFQLEHIVQLLDMFAKQYLCYVYWVTLQVRFIFTFE